MLEGFCCIIEIILTKNKKPVDYRFLDINPAFENQTGLHDAKETTLDLARITKPTGLRSMEASHSPGNQRGS